MAGRSRPDRLAAKGLPAKSASLRTQQDRGLNRRPAARRPQPAHRSWLKSLRDFVIGLAICAGLVSWWVGSQHPDSPQPKNPAQLNDLAATLPPALQSLADGGKSPLPPPPSSALPASKPHFPLKDIVVIGNHHLPKAEVLANLPFVVGDAMGSINLQLAAKKLQQLPWIKQVNLHRDWVRQQVVVDVQEWQAVALLQQQGQVKLMNADGLVLNAPLTPAFGQFILLVGAGAAKRWAGLDHLLASQPTLRERVKTASWVGNRRWDLQLDNGVTIKLPEVDAAAALAKFVSLDHAGREGAIPGTSRLAPPITMVDLRLPDRVTLRGLPAGKPKLPAPKQFDKANKLKQPHPAATPSHKTLPAKPLSLRERET